MFANIVRSQTVASAFVLVLVCGGASACSSSAVAPVAPGADASTDTPTSEVDAVPSETAPDARPGVTGSGKILGYASVYDPGKPLEGVAICVLDHAEIPCVKSDATGGFSLPGIPPGAEVSISFTTAGYYGILEVLHSPSTDFVVDLPSGYGMFTDAYEAAFFKSAGWTWPAPDKGVLHAHAWNTGTTTCTGVDKTTFAASTGVAPVYAIACASGVVDQNGPGTADPTLTATTTIGDAFFLAASGAIEVTATHPTLKCSQAAPPGWGFPSTKPGAVRAIVKAGHETVVIEQCK